MFMNSKDTSFNFPDNHIVVLYNDDSEIVDLLVEYIKSNLLKGIKCIYISGDANTELIIKNLKNLIYLDEYIANKQFIVLDKDESYSKNGTFNPDKMVDMLISETKKSIDEGFKGLAVTGEISWVLEYQDGFDKILEYEWKLDEQVFSKFPISSICRYNLNSFSSEMIINIIQVHPYIIWENEVHENPFYIPYEGFKSNSLSEYQVKNWLKNISDFTNTKIQLQKEIEKQKQELVESEEDYKYIFDNSAIGKSLSTPSGEISVNQAFCDLVGYTKDELKGIRWQQITHPDDIEVNEKHVKDILEGRKKTARFKKRYIKKDGEVIWVDINTSLRRDKQSNPLYFMTSIIDITKQVENKTALANNEHKLNLIFQDAPYGIFVSNEKGFYIDVNQEACKMTGYTKDELVNMNFAKLFVPEDRKIAVESFNKIVTSKAGITKKDKLRYLTKDGKTEIWSVKLIRQADNRYIVFTENITKKVALEKTLDEERLEAKALFDNAGLGIAYYTPEGRVIWFNKVAAENMGGVPEDFEGKTYWEIFSKAEADKYYKRLTHCITHKETVEYEDTHELPIGTVYFRNIVNCIYDSNNKIKGVQIISQDITDLKRSERDLSESRKVFKLMFDDAPLAYQSLDENGNFIQVNKAWSEMLGYDKGDVVGKSFGEYVMPEFKEHFVQNFPRFKESGETCTDFDMPTKEGQVASIKFHGKIGYNDDGTFSQTHCILQDVTDQKRAERLELEKQKAEESTRLKSEFLAKMSHEIRTPINAIMGFTDLINNTELTEKQNDYIRKINGSSKALLNIINDILDYSKIEAGKLSIEETRLSVESVLNSVKDNMDLKATKKGISLYVDVNKNVPKYVVGDPLRLEQILLNLASNAIKFTDKGSVKITANSIEEQNDLITLEFRVKDTGIGIKDTDLTKLFSPFTQADTSTTRKYGGTGLGLVISTSLVEMMGGDISVESVFGEGTEFIFTVTVYKYKDNAIAKNVCIDIPSFINKLEVLVVIENNYTRSVFFEYLSQLGITPKLLSSGEEAIEDISKNNYDLIIMDCIMQGMSGIESWYIIKNMILSVHIPKLIMITSYGTTETLKAASAENADAVLTKPVTQSMLYDTIIKVFNSRITTGINSQLANKEVHITKSENLGTSILLVEDNKINQQVARELLEVEGYTIDTAGNGKIALDMLKCSNKYKIILMDVQMPVMDGYETSRHIRANNLYNNIPIIALSADAMPEAIKQAISAGMDDYITKPIDQTILYHKVNKWVIYANLRQEGNNMNKTINRQNLIEMLPNIEAEEGLARINNNVDLYVKILKKFCKDYSGVSDKVISLFNECKYKEVRIELHTLKGVSATIGINSINKLSAEMERRILDNELNKEVFMEMNAKLKQTISKTVDDIVMVIE